MAPHIVDILRPGSPWSSISGEHRAARGLDALADRTGGRAHELHHLDMPDAICKQRLRARNAGSEHQFQVSDAEYEQFTAHFVPPGADEGFNVIVHKP